MPPGRTQLVGDDLFVTNVERLERGIRALRERDPGEGEPDRRAHRDAGRAARWRSGSGFGVVVSHRSGETEDTTIADLAVATNAGRTSGRPSRGERTAKFNELLRIEERLGDDARYAGAELLGGGGG